MDQIREDNIDDVFVVTLSNGVTNPINLETTRALLKVISNVLKKETKINGLVLTSNNTKFFSIGFDIPQLIELDRNGLTEFYRAFNKLCLELYSIPIPTVTAISGHCIAAGCIIAACTDCRYMVDGKYKIGVTAAKLGLPVPFLANGIIHQVIGTKYATELLSTGDLFDINWAKASGYITKIKSHETLINDSINFINQVTTDSTRSFIKEKIRRTSLIKQVYNANKLSDEKIFIDKWFTTEVQKKLKKAKKKFSKK